MDDGRLPDRDWCGRWSRGISRGSESDAPENDLLTAAGNMHRAGRRRAGYGILPDELRPEDRLDDRFADRGVKLARPQPAGPGQ
jgi:hypothetical protein